MAAQTTDIQGFQVTKGPSKFDLMLAVFDSTFDNPRCVKFKLDNGDELTIGVRCVELEDGSGESFSLKGYISRIDRLRNSHERVSYSHDISGYYSTRTRTGYIKSAPPI